MSKKSLKEKSFDERHRWLKKAAEEILSDPEVVKIVKRVRDYLGGAR